PRSGGALSGPAPVPAPRFGGGPGGHSPAIDLLRDVNRIFFLFLLAALAAFLLRRRLLRGRRLERSRTWGCAYIAPTSRMQYSAGSFSRPAAFLMRSILRQKAELPAISEYFPIKAKAALTTPDWVQDKGYAPLFSLVGRAADLCKSLQHGRVNGYILYILLTLVALVAWKIR
ncbi:MAG: hypothetical protein LBV01_04800, partial [Deltaproteobacteria bacterium]|nr:hypothetical protein [Deltaproteobacteria bacterium]